MAEINISLSSGGSKKTKDPFLDKQQIHKATNDAAKKMIAFPEIWSVTRNNGDNSFNLRRAVGTKKGVYAVDPFAYQFILVGYSVMVVYENLDPNRPKIVGFRGIGGTSEFTLLIAQWPEQWGSFMKNAIANSTVNYSDWPGSQVATYTTDTGGATGSRTNPQGMLAFDEFFVMVHRMSTLPSTVPNGMKLRFYKPKTSWTQVFEIDIPFTEDRDKITANYDVDSQVFYDRANQIITVFSRCYDSFTPSVAASDKCSVWTVYVPSTASSSSDCTVTYSEITMSNVSTDRLAANCMTVAGDRMIKGNLLVDTVRGFELVNKEWRDLWTLNWSNELKSIVGGSAYWSSLGQNGSVVGTSNTYNIGPPAVILDNELRWKLYASSIDGDIYNKRSDLWEMSVNANTGKLKEAISVFRLGSVGISDSESISALSTFLDSEVKSGVSTPTPTWGASSTASIAVLDNTSTVQYVDRTTNSTWLGPMAQSNSVSVTDSSGNPQTVNIPANIPATSPVSHSITPIMLPGPYANTAVSQRWILQSSSPVPISFLNKNSRAVSTNDGYRYFAAMVPVGPFDLGVYDFSVYGHATKKQTVKNYTYLGAGWNPEWFDSTVDIYGGTVINPSLVHETYIFSVSPNGDVISRALNNRHSGFDFRYPYSTSVDVDTPIPVPENVWQVMYLPSINRIAWLHDSRQSYEADPIPMITITDRELNTVYTIPASSIFNISYFGSDQFYTAAPTVRWAYAGQATRKFHSVDNQGPIMKAYVNGSNTYIILGTEVYDFVEPVAGNAGTTYSSTLFIKVSATGFSIDKKTTTSQAWTWPNVASGNLNGPSPLRALAIMEDRIIFRRAGASIREVM